MTITFPTIAFWLGSMAAVLVLARARLQPADVLQYQYPFVAWFKAFYRPVLVATALLVVGLSPWGYQVYQDRAERHEYARLLPSFQDALRAQGIEDAVPGVYGRGEWWVIPYTSATKGNGILMTTGKDQSGEDVWVKIQ